HGDYGAKWIRNFVFDADHNPLEVKNFIDNAGNCVFLNTHPTQGGLWYVRYPDQIRKVSYTGNLNRPPVATPEADALHGPAPLTVQFTGDQSFDPDFDPLSYLWEFGDGNSSTEANPLHTFNAAGGAPTAFTVTLTVSDDQGASDQKTLTITLNNTPPVIQSTSLDNLSTFSVSNPTTLSLSATVSDAEHPNAQLSWSWEVALHHNDHNHPEAPIQSPSGTALLTPVGCDGATYWYRIRLTVSDPLGAAAVFVKDLFPDCPGSAQTLTFPPVPDKLITDGPFDPGASASSGLPVQYFVAGGPAAVSGGVISLTGEPGLVTLVATQPGDGTFAPAAPV
ncbi:MAG: PKD domain-containing protein, partial [Bacteroidetes bacterium]